MGGPAMVLIVLPVAVLTGFLDGDHSFVPHLCPSLDVLGSQGYMFEV
jgi:hypothetical protein